MCRCVLNVVPGDTYRYAVNPFIADPVEALHFELQSARMSKIKNSELDQYGAEPFGQQKFGRGGIEEVNVCQHEQHAAQSVKTLQLVPFRSVQQFQRYARGQTDTQTYGLITIHRTPTGAE